MNIELAQKVLVENEIKKIGRIRLLNVNATTFEIYKMFGYLFNEIEGQYNFWGQRWSFKVGTLEKLGCVFAEGTNVWYTIPVQNHAQSVKSDGEAK